MTNTLTHISAASSPADEDLDNLAVWLEHRARQSGWLERTAYLQGTHRHAYAEVYDRVRRTAGPCGGWASDARTGCYWRCPTASPSWRRSERSCGSVRWPCR